MEDNYQAPNYQDSLFANLGLPATNQNPSQPQNQISLNFTNTRKENNNRYLQKNQQSQQQQEKQQTKQTYIEEPIQKHVQSSSNIPKNKQKNVVRTMRRGGAKKGKSTNKTVDKNAKKQQIEIDVELNEVAEWGEKGTKNNNDDDSFDESEIKEEQMAQNIAGEDQIRRKIEQKVKKYENPTQKRKQGNSLNSLKNKAQQLKRKNEQKPELKEEDNSTHNLNLKKIQNNIEEEQEESEDPWDKINEKTMAKQQKQKIQKQQMTIQTVLQFYKELNSEEKQIVVEELGEQKQQPSFLQMLCGCLKPSKKGYTDTQIQIISISKIKLSSNPKQTFLLKQIWTKLTHKNYQRFGEHWNEIGFQGRDPGTDLRSTGILSLIHWNLFLIEHEQYAIKIHNFCQQFGIPLALTHIKVTSLVVSSLRKSALQGKTWEDYQEWYNALTYYTFNKLMKQAKNIEQIGEVVQKTVESAGKNLSVAKKNYHIDVKRK